MCFIIVLFRNLESGKYTGITNFELAMEHVFDPKKFENISQVYKRLVLAAKKNPPILIKSNTELANRVLFSQKKYVAIIDEIVADDFKNKYCNLEYVVYTGLNPMSFNTLFFRNGLNLSLEPSYRHLVPAQYRIFTKILNPPRHCDSAYTKRSSLNLEQMQAAWIVGACSNNPIQLQC